ncbi:MAG: hypothetical protein AUG48_04140 [Actinobacteria bacterium 13_1_20CM_3_68_9]|nr:MAG: hypothetical protein AUG48_04140 [Actinobacteria bacterium 13_1_20CM_3_68_9]
MTRVATAAPETALRPIAQVAVEARVGSQTGLFDYAVPEALMGVIEVGHRVRVPFGKRTVTGFVYALDQGPTVLTLRPIEALLEQVLAGEGQALVLIPEIALTAQTVGRFAARFPGRLAVLAGRRNLDGLRVVVSAGGTREAVDPVRYVGNFSSGKMGRALAEVAAARGAEVTLVTTLPSHAEGIAEVPVGTASEMLQALTRACADADVLVMAAAVADYAPQDVAASKLRRTERPMELRLRPNIDILKSLGPRRGLFRVGFAAETEDLRAQAQVKLKAKQLDMIVANQVGVDGQGLASDFNAVTVVTPAGVVAEVPRLPKWEVAGRIWDAIDASRNRGA